MGGYLAIMRLSPIATGNAYISSNIHFYAAVFRACFCNGINEATKTIGASQFSAINPKVRQNKNERLSDHILSISLRVKFVRRLEILLQSDIHSAM